MKFSEIFKRFYVLYRGQATRIPASGSREYLTAVEFANDAIDEWARADDVQWPELWVNSVDEDALVIADGTVDYDVTDMQEPPAYVNLSTDGQTDIKLKVIRPWEVRDMSSLRGYCYFTGSANTSYSFHIDSEDATQYDGYAVDFPYLKKPSTITGDNDEPEMSDPSFVVHHMVMLQGIRQRNGYLQKSFLSSSKEKLSAMKLKALTGTYGNSARQKDTQPGYGKATTGESFFGR